MGLIATLLKLSGAKLDTKGNAPGKSVIVTGDGFENQTLTPEVYQNSGIIGVPPDGARGVFIPVGGSSRYGIIIACQNYQIEIALDAGDTAIYSTTSDGKTVKAKIVLDNDGKITHESDGNTVFDSAEIHLNGNSKKLVTYAELNTALDNFKTSITSAISGAITGHTHVCAAPGSPSATGIGTTPPITLDISASETTTVKTGG